MSTRALAADKELIVNTDTYVSSALAFPVQAVLPKINDGSAGSVAVDTDIRVEVTSAAPVELVTLLGRRVGIVPGRSQAIVVARTGTVQAEPDDWNFFIRPNSPNAFQAIGAAFNQAEVTALRTCLVDHGLMKAE